MLWPRATLRLLRPLLAAIVIAPAIALGVAVTIDRGADGTMRPGLLPLALAGLDPFVWTCAWNSLATAAIVAALSLAIGLALALALGRRFWGRSLLATLALAPLAVPPGLAAIGLRAWRARLGLGGSTWPVHWNEAIVDLNAWLAWVGLGVIAGGPIVALAVGASLCRIAPTC